MDRAEERLRVVFVLYCFLAEAVLVRLLFLTELPDGAIALWALVGWVLIPFASAPAYIACVEGLGRWLAQKKDAPAPPTTERGATPTECDSDDAATDDAATESETSDEAIPESA